MSTTIYVVRHGESVTNSKDKVIHTIDLNSWGEFGAPLTEIGKQQAEKIAERLSTIKFDAIFSSDLQRAKQTAEIIAHSRNMAVTSISSIRERNYGNDYFKLPPEKKAEIQSALMELNDEEKMLYRYTPTGESAREAVDRFNSFLKDISSAYKGKTILVVNHGNIMRMFLITIGWAQYDELPHNSIRNTGYYVLTEGDGKFTIKETYDVHKK